MYVLVGSITTAMRLKRLLDNVNGIDSDVVHTPTKLKDGGCSYSLRASNDALDAVKQICDEYSVNIRKIYIDKVVGKERVFDAVPR